MPQRGKGGRNSRRAVSQMEVGMGMIERGVEGVEKMGRRREGVE